jgi:hypothetical protein
MQHTVRGKNLGIIECMKGYQPRTSFAKDGNDYLIVNSHNILNRTKNYFSLLNVHRVSDVRQMEIQLSH